MVRRFVEQQGARAGCQRAGQPDAVSLSVREGEQFTLAVGAGAEALQRDIDAAVGVPGVQQGHPIKGLLVSIAKITAGQSVVQIGQCLIGRRGGLSDGSPTVWPGDRPFPGGPG